jgi:ASC-1-like (ASCH) protein
MLDALRAVLLFLAVVALILLALALAFQYAPRRRRAVGGRDGECGGRDDGAAWDEDDGGAWDDRELRIDGGAGFRLRMRDPGYTAALEGKKTVEGRLDRPPFNKLKAGDTITVARSRPPGDTAEDPGERRFMAQIRHVKKYPSFHALVEGEGLKAVAPGIKTAAAAVAAFREFVDEAAEKEHGVLAIAFERAP